MNIVIPDYLIDPRAIDTYKMLYELFYSLNDDLLADLERYCKNTSADMVINGDCYNEYTLTALIEKHSYKYPCDSKFLKTFIQELKEDTSISSMSEYYEIIDYMLYDIDL